MPHTNYKQMIDKQVKHNPKTNECILITKVVTPKGESITSEVVTSEVAAQIKAEQGFC